MNDITAVIVGIEKYDQPAWSVPGPCRSALEIADYLISVGTKPANIFLFANEKPGDGPSAIQPELTRLKALGVTSTMTRRD
jgi:hypothetical protein